MVSASYNQILITFINQLELLLQTQNGSEEDSHNIHDFSTRKNQSEPVQLMIENQDVYRTLQLVKNSIILDLIHYYITEVKQLALANDMLGESISGLTMCLKIKDTKICPGKN